MKVFKYILEKTDFPTVMMPTNARLLSVGVQGRDIVLWALVDEEEVTVVRVFRLAGTGHPVVPHADGIMSHPKHWGFIGTVEYPGNLWFHLFDTGVIV